MRPLWERVTTWGIADHLRAAGIGTDASAYAVAALIVRALDRRFNLQAEMARYHLVAPADVSDPAKTSAKYLAVMQAFWKTIGTPAGAERNKLLALADFSALRGGALEAQAAAVLAQDAKSVESTMGKLGQGWSATGWSGLSGLSGFGALRDELALTGDASVLSTYDHLASAGADRSADVRAFQTWAKGPGYYTGPIDGGWGSLTEAAFLVVVPTAAGRLSTLADVAALRSVFVEILPGDVDAKALALLITRDIWLSAHPAKMVAEVPAGGGIVVSYPKAESASASPAVGGGSQIVVTYPKTETTPEQTVAITLPAATASVTPVTASSGVPTDLLVGGGLVLGGLLFTGVVVWLSRRKPPLMLTEDTP